MSFTAKIKSVKGSLAASNYKANIEKGAELLKAINLTGETVKERFEEKKLVARMNLKVSKPFIEAVFSPHKSVSKNWKKEDWISHVDEFCRRIGIPDDVQLEYYIHRNTATPHVHISANRLNIIGKNVIPDSFIGKKAEIVCDKMAQQRNLPSAKDRGKIEKENIKNAIISSKSIATSWNNFIVKMYERGYHFELSKNVNGINGARICNLEDIENYKFLNYKLEKTKGYKLSQIDRKLKVIEIENQLFKNTMLIDLKRQNNENNQPKFKR
ncbi:relaxase/mobilization nuclease domain-containing protein [Empedobacter falsenii]|uniref:relaxase/mobilization nuclease domain-containing protein n=1 Tax=Empedobacter falsenii TaxID=343874 RepID=UPI003A7F999F